MLADPTNCHLKLLSRDCIVISEMSRSLLNYVWPTLPE
jgi:hypothetical protein